MTTESNQIDTMNQRSALADFWACFEDAEDDDERDAEILRCDGCDDPMTEWVEFCDKMICIECLEAAPLKRKNPSV